MCGPFRVIRLAIVRGVLLCRPPAETPDRTGRQPIWAWYNMPVQLGRPAEKEFTDSLLHTFNRCSYTVIALKTEITPGIVRDLLDYNPQTGIFTWKPRSLDWFGSERAFKIWNKNWAGARAGGETFNTKGYRSRRIKVLRRIMKEHHLAWMWMMDQELPEQIDHANRDATDNRWCNLRASTNRKNSRNQSMRRDNTSGATGVSWIKRRGCWRASVGVSGVVNILGHFESIEDAKAVVTEFRSKNGFDPGHGIQKAHYHS